MTTIESRRFALLVAAGVVGFLLYQAWEKDFAPAVIPPPPSASAPPVDDVPVAPAAPAKAAGAAAPAATQATTAAPEQRITVQTDVLTVVLSTLGGDIRRVELSGYPYDKKSPDQNVALLDDTNERWFVIQSGLTGAQGPIVSHKDTYRAATTSYALAPDAASLDVPLEFDDGAGRHVTKTFHFERGSYLVGLKQKLHNGGAAPVSANAYVQLWRTPFPAGAEPRFSKPFMGVAIYEQKNPGESLRFRKIAFKDLVEEPVERHQSGGWIGMLQHYFFIGVIPPAGEADTLIAKPNATRGFAAQYIGGAHDVPAGGDSEFTAQLYIGPKLQKKLADIAPGLELTLDYGILEVIAKPLFWLLDLTHKFTQNWGFSIILLTLMVKLGLFPLSAAQFRSMAKMKKFAPRIQELKDRYGDDREKMNQAMMDLYKKEKFNPLAGCWPLLIQMPIFLALYWVLLESVELRQADFALWLNDLSAPDPFYVLPLLFGASMWAQQKLSGTVVADPVQQRVMSMMPVFLTVFFAFFPAGLVLYWFVSNLIGIGQQWIINRTLTKEGLR